MLCFVYCGTLEYSIDSQMQVERAEGATGEGVRKGERGGKKSKKERRGGNDEGEEERKQTSEGVGRKQS